MPGSVRECISASLLLRLLPLDSKDRIELKNLVLRGAILIGVMVVAISCGGTSGAVPTTTRIARAEATQTPIIIYVPVTTTPEPFTATPLPTVTSAGPTRTPTRPPQPPQPPQPTRPPVAAATNTPVPAPSNTAAPACGQALKVAALTFPEDGATRNTASGGGPTIQFKFTPVVNYPLDSSIGYRVDMKNTRTNRPDARYMSHNKYFPTNGPIILDGKALWIMAGGDDGQMEWTVTVIKASGGFDESTDQPIGTVADCGSPTGPFRIYVHVLG